MNIFVLDKDPDEAARAQCDPHTIKMCVEALQMLSTAHHVLDGDHRPDLYRPAYVNHPATRWARERAEHYAWLWQHAARLHVEADVRYGWHSNRPRQVLTSLVIPPSAVPGEWSVDSDGPRAAPPEYFVQCMPDDCRRPDPVEAYRTFYRIDKAGFATWTRGRPPPSWWWPEDRCESAHEGGRGCT